MYNKTLSDKFSQSKLNNLRNFFRFNYFLLHAKEKSDFFYFLKFLPYMYQISYQKNNEILNELELET